jgi:hypothetical protein
LLLVIPTQKLNFSEVTVQKILAALLGVLILVAAPPLGFGWGSEGHEVVALIAENNMTPATLERAKAILGGAGVPQLREVAGWADEYRRDHRETGPGHYINIPQSDSRIDMTRECPKGDRMIGKTDQFLAVLKDSKADQANKAEALKLSYTSSATCTSLCMTRITRTRRKRPPRDLRRPSRQPSLGVGHRPGRTDWSQSAGARNGTGAPNYRARPDDWVKGSIEDWVMEGHALAQTAVYRNSETGSPASITASYEKQAEAVIEIQLEKAGVRLAHLLNEALRWYLRPDG